MMKFRTSLVLFILLFSVTVPSLSTQGAEIHINNTSTVFYNFTGNHSSSVSHPTSLGYSFSTNTLDTTTYTQDALHLVGNGQLQYNLSALAQTFVIPQNKAIEFSWIDAGQSSYATYTGIYMRLRDQNNNPLTFYIQKYYAGTYANASTSLLLRASPSIAFNQSVEYWGVNTNDMYSYFSATSLIVSEIWIIHASSSSFNGPRDITYFNPVLTDTLVRDTDASGPYLRKVGKSTFIADINKLPTPGIGTFYDIIGNLGSANLLPSSTGYTFNQVSPTYLKNQGVLRVLGNGQLNYNLTSSGTEFILPLGLALTIDWYDNSSAADATYTGFYLRLKDGTGTSYSFYMAKYNTGIYTNGTNGMYVFSSPTVQPGTAIEHWGIHTSDIYTYFAASKLKVSEISIIHAASLSYNGPRDLQYFNPRLVYTLTQSNGASGNYLGSTPLPPSSDIATLPVPGTGTFFDMTSNFTSAELVPTSTGYSFNDVRTTTFNHTPVLDVTGNGQVFYNLTKLGYEFVLPHDLSLTMDWFDNSSASYATYTGLFLRLEDANYNFYSFYMAKYYTGTYGNSTFGMFTRSTPYAPTGTAIEHWGINTNAIYNYFNVASLKVTDLRVIHASSSYYHGPRHVLYSNPQLVSSLTRSSNAQGPYLGSTPVNDFSNVPVATIGQFFDLTSNLNQAYKNATSTGYQFDDVSTASFSGTPALKVVGNGHLVYDLSVSSQEVLLPHNSAFIINWLDNSTASDATYIGINLQLIDIFNNSYSLYIAKYNAGTFLNSSNGMYNFASPTIDTGKPLEVWGIETNAIYSYFNVTNLMVTQLSIIHASSSAYNGPREVYYFNPIIVNNIADEIVNNTRDGPFLGSIALPTVPTTTTTTSPPTSTTPTNPTTTGDSTTSNSTSISAEDTTPQVSLGSNFLLISIIAVFVAIPVYRRKFRL